MAHRSPTVRWAACLLGVTLLLQSACSNEKVNPPRKAQDAAPQVAAEYTQVLANPDPAEWLTHGRTYDEQRHSPLTRINPQNLSRLGLAWYFDTGQYRGHEATPLVHDGVMYLTSTWSNVFALDARTGQQLWAYDAAVPRAMGRMACCDVVNRGVALWQDAVIVGTIDGRLVSLDASTGRERWSVKTTPEDVHYTITGAPRVVKGLVIIGNGGAEFGVRGFVSAYHAASGELAWRFYTVPGDPQQPVENPALLAAIPTWSGQWWTMGGGGTAWDAMAYDPELNLLYVGTGNGAPWSRHHRSPGGGDNLYLSSILALNPDDGSLVWYYQTTPGDNWDYTATQHIMLADLPIDGELRKVLMQAPKNGFFYVLDRASGELISAEKYALVTWASHIDPDSGRPVETAAGQYSASGGLVYPSAIGGHNWHPMAYSPQHQLVYIPKQDMAAVHAIETDFEVRRGTFNTATFVASSLLSELPERPIPREYLQAWDPVAQQEAWAVTHADGPNGGVLSTASGLVVQGNALGELNFYAADSGQLLHTIALEIGMIAPPITYELNGEQYLTIVAGAGGAGVRQAEQLRHKLNVGRVYTFKLGADLPLPEVPDKPAIDVTPPETFGTPEQLVAGEELYRRHCQRCHGGQAMSQGIIRDLRHAAPAVHQNWNEIVLHGMFEPLGMAGFSDILSEADAQAIRSYVVAQANVEPTDSEDTLQH